MRTAGVFLVLLALIVAAMSGAYYAKTEMFRAVWIGFLSLPLAVMGCHALLAAHKQARPLSRQERLAP